VKREKRIVSLIFSIFFIFSLKPSAASAADVPIDDFLSDIQKVLIKVRDASDVDALPALTAVHLTIRTTLSREANGSLKFHIIEAGAKGSDESVQEIRLELQPPGAADKSPVAASVAPLADAIIDAARNVKKATTRDPPLHLTALEASVEFTVEKEASGNLVFVGAKAGSKNTQKIVISFGKSE
jgi:Trypsin-co-occurring domain 2